MAWTDDLDAYDGEPAELDIERDLEALAAALDQDAPPIADVPFALTPPKHGARRGKQSDLFGGGQ